MSFKFIDDRILCPNEQNLIFTSPRAVDYLSQLPNYKELLDKRCFVVGPKTYEKASAIGFTCEGQESGCADELVKYILSSEVEGNFAFITGAKRNPVIKSVLQSKGYTVNEIVVYKSSINSNIIESVQAYQAKVDDNHIIICLFSPSVVEELSKFLVMNKNLFDLVAIGPSTAQKIQEYELTVSAVCSSPTPQDLVEKIQSLLK